MLSRCIPLELVPVWESENYCTCSIIKGSQRNTISPQIVRYCSPPPPGIVKPEDFHVTLRTEMHPISFTPSLPHLAAAKLGQNGIKKHLDLFKPQSKKMYGTSPCVFSQFNWQAQEETLILLLPKEGLSSHFSPILSQFFSSCRWSSLQRNWMQPVSLFTVLIYSLAASWQSFSYLCFQLNLYFFSPDCQGERIALLYLCICCYVFNYLNKVQCVFCPCIHVIVHRLWQF